MDPAEAFEISAGEIMGNTYDRLVRFDVADPSKLYGDVAKSWTVGADGKTYAFELKPGLKFASGNALTAEDVVFSLQRAVLLDKTPAFILTQFGFTKDNVKEPDQADGSADADDRDGEIVRAVLRAQLPHGERRGHRRQEARAVEGGERRSRLRLAQDQLRRLRSAEAPRVARQRDRGARAQRQLLRRESRSCRASSTGT